MIDRGEWGRLVDAVLDAPSLSSSQAAAAELIDAAVPGGAAVDASVRSLVEAVSERARELAGARYRAYVLAALVAVGTWLRTWRRAASANASLMSVADEEAAIERALDAFCDAGAAMLDDPDDEARSMMCLLVGTVGDPGRAFDTLAERYLREPSTVVRGFVIQGQLRAVARMPDAMGELSGVRLAGVLGAAPPEVCARANHEVRGSWRTPRERAELLARVEVPACTSEPFLWPAEGL
jgi:hypothetical protein